MTKTREPPETQTPNFGDDALETNGIRSNRNAQFTFTLSGQETYRTLQTFENLAVDTPHFNLVRQCVLLSEKIRNQAREQGF